MKIRKTSKDKRINYIYYQENGSKTILTPGENGVTEANIEILHYLDDVEFNNNRTETRRHLSLDKSIEENIQYADKFDVEEEVWRKFDNEDLQKVISQLNSKQQELIKAIFFEGIKKSEFAERKGVSHQAISSQLSTVLKKLRKKIF